MNQPDSPPDNRCPFSRPFPPGFSRCAGFEPAVFEQGRGTYAQVRPIGSCASLVVGRMSTSGYYAKCTKGGAAVFAPPAPPRTLDEAL